MKLTIQVWKVSMENQSILRLWRETDDFLGLPSVSLQMPTDIIEYLRQLIMDDQNKWIKAELKIIEGLEKRAMQKRCNHQWDDSGYGASVCNICGKIERD